ASLLRCERVWLAQAHERDLEPLRDVTGVLDLEPGVGAPGAAWAERRAVWRSVEDEGSDGLSRRAAALESGLSGVLAFPLLGGGAEVVGVIDLWRRADRPGDEVVELL